MTCYASGKGASIENQVVLEEYTYKVDGSEDISKLAEWLAENALPTGEAYNWWRTELASKLIILPDDDFRDFTHHATEVVTRIRIKNDTKTVQDGALWTEESLPIDTLLYAPAHATRFRVDKDDLPEGWGKIEEAEEQAQSILDWVSSNIPERIQIGGDETVGRGIISLRWQGGA